MEEGTIRFAYSLTTPSGELLPADAFAGLAAWRSMLRDLHILGQDTNRYGGFGFGNVSVRQPDSQSIVITASQTSGDATFNTDSLTRLDAVNFDRFWVEAVGHQPPSSEALTHAMIYASDARIRAVLHVHSPAIWRHAEALALPCTDAQTAYGTPAMVGAVQELLTSHQTRPLVFVTLGHEDGVFACGADLSLAGARLIAVLARARQLELSS